MSPVFSIVCHELSHYPRSFSWGAAPTTIYRSTRFTYFICMYPILAFFILTRNLFDVFGNTWDIVYGRWDTSIIFFKRYCLVFTPFVEYSYFCYNFSLWYHHYNRSVRSLVDIYSPLYPITNQLQIFIFPNREVKLYLYIYVNQSIYYC